MTRFRSEWKQIWYCQPVVASVVDGGFIGRGDAGRGCISSDSPPAISGGVTVVLIGKIGSKVGTGLNVGSDGGSG